MSLCAPTFFHLGAHVLLGENISVEPCTSGVFVSLRARKSMARYVQTCRTEVKAQTGFRGNCKWQIALSRVMHIHSREGQAGKVAVSNKDMGGDAQSAPNYVSRGMYKNRL